MIIDELTKKSKIMEQKNLALCTREEFEKELDKMYPCSLDGMNPGEFDAAFEERVRVRNNIKWARIEALLDGKLTVDQVVEQEHTEYHGDDIDYDEIHRGILERALENLKDGKDRNEIIEETFEALEKL